MKRLFSFEGFKKNVLDKMINDGQTYVKKSERQKNLSKVDQDILNHDYSNFRCVDKIHHFEIHPDEKFVELCYQKGLTLSQPFICSISNSDLHSNIKNTISATKYPNKIDFESGIPSLIRGLSVGYNIYKILAKYHNYIISEAESTIDNAKNLWYNLLQDSSLYAGTNGEASVIIDKNISDEKLKNILNKLSEFNFIYDDDLTRYL